MGRDVVWGLWAGERCMDEIHLGGEVGSVSEGTKEGRRGRRTTLTYVMVFPGQAQVVDWPGSSSVWVGLGGTLATSEDPGGADAALQLRRVQVEGVARVQGGVVVVLGEESTRGLVDELGRGVVDMINWIVDDGIHAGLVWWRRGGCRGVLVMVPGGEGDCRVERTMWRVLRECERVIVGRIVH